MSESQQQGININDHGQVTISYLKQKFILHEKRDRSEAAVLKAVWSEVEGRLAQSLHERVYIELQKQEDPHQVVRPWDLDVKEGNAPSRRCEPNTPIEAIFDRPQIGGRLLLLGAPGSGKTTMLLQLARVLVDRASKNMNDPVPVLLNLSAWKANYKDISMWMIEDLKLKYGVRRDVGERWITEKRILPLLDGLDELMSERQETCVNALNEFLANNWVGMPLVVCSRLLEYEVYQTKLGLNGAVTLQPLEDAQIKQYLKSAQVGWVWENIRQDANFMNPSDGLARSPFFLTILVLTSDSLPSEMWQPKTGIKSKHQVLFEAYIQRRLARQYYSERNLPVTKQGKTPYPNNKQTRKWLSWLATLLVNEKKTEFFIDKLQPRFLTNQLELAIYGVIGGLMGALIGLLVGIVFLGLIFSPKFGAVFGIFVGFVSGPLYAFWGEDTIIPSESLNVSITSICKKFNFYLIDGLKYGMPYGIVFGFVYGVFNDVISGFLLACMYMAYYAIVYSIIKSITSVDVDNKLIDNQGIWKSIKNLFVCAFLILPIGLSMAFLLNHLRIIEVTSFRVLLLGISLSLVFGADAGGCSATFKHASLRTTLYLFKYSPWNYSKFLRYCTERGFLQRVGGGYRFVHALLRDHFAETYNKQIPHNETTEEI